jgi:hypothetical protein
VAGKALFHAAWQFFTDRWLNIPHRPLSTPLDGGKAALDNEDAAAGAVLNSISSLNVQDAGRETLEYLNSGFSGDRLLHEIGRAMVWDDTNMQTLPTLSAVFDEWERRSGPEGEHPARRQLLVGLARYATDIRTNKDSGSATNTAMRFAEGKTTVEVFE